MRNIKKLIAIAIALIFMLSSLTISNANVSTLSEHEITKHDLADYFAKKTYCNATTADDFASDVVLIIINRFESEVNKRHSIEEIATVVSDKYLREDGGRYIVTGNSGSAKSFSKYTEHNDQIAENIMTMDDISKLEGDPQKMAVNPNDFRQIYSLKLCRVGKHEVLNMIEMLEKNPLIECAQPDFLAPLEPCTTTPTDPGYNSSYDNRWGLVKISAPAAWDMTTGSRSIKIGVLDTGINEHVDFHSGSSCNLVQGKCFIPGMTATTDNYIDPYQNVGHGTHVAGIVGACANNQTGSVGVCWCISLVPMKAFHTLENKGQTSSVIANAMQWATEQCILIVTCSLGFSYSVDYVVNTAIQNYPGLFVLAAGNTTEQYPNGDLDVYPYYPVCSRISNVISVAASTKEDQLKASSCYGKHSVDLAAPGNGIYNTMAAGGYGTMGGTSHATPHVAGVAGLILSKYPHMTTAQLKESILNSVDSISAFSNKLVTGGRLNAYAALQYAERFSLNSQGYPLADGTYYIRNLKSGLVLDVPNSGGTGTQTIQYSQNHASNQIWRVERQSDGNYSLSPMHNAQLKLTVENGSANNNDRVIVKTPTFANVLPASASWKLVTNANGAFQLQSSCSNYTKVLAVQGASTEPEACCIQYTYGSSQNDQWIFEDATPLDDGIYRLKSVNNNGYLSVNGGSSSTGAQCATLPLSEADYKLWQLKTTDDGTYDIRPLNALEMSMTAASSNANANMIISGMTAFGGNSCRIIPNSNDYSSYRIMTDISNYQYALSVDSTNISAWCTQTTYNSSSNAAKWIIEYVRPLQTPGIAEGIYRIKNVRSGMYLDVPNSATADGTQIKQYQNNGNNTMTSNQLWRVKYNWDSTYTISPMHCQTKSLRVTGAANDAYIQLYPTDGSVITQGASCRWQILYNNDSYQSYRIASCASNFQKVIAIEGASLAEGACALQFTFGNATNDRWIFERISTSN